MSHYPPTPLLLNLVCFYRSVKKTVRRKLGDVTVDLTEEQEDFRLAFGATRQDVIDLTGEDEDLTPACRVQAEFPPLAAGAGVFLSNWVGVEQNIVRRNPEPIYKCDVDCLRPNTWLNDGVVNWYMQLLYRSSQNLQSKMYPLSSYTYELMRSEHQKNELNNYKKFLRYAKGIVFSECNYVIFPIHKPGHWCLVVAYPRKLKLAYYDPMGLQDNYSKMCLEILEGYLRARGQAIEAETRLNADWTRLFVGPNTFPECIPKQGDDHSCGLFACALADVLCAGGPGPSGNWGFSQADMGMFRKLVHCLIMSA